jgi:hypothetical protein
MKTNLSKKQLRRGKPIKDTSGPKLEHVTARRRRRRRRRHLLSLFSKF